MRSQKSRKTPEQREIEIQGAKYFGKHVSPEKGKLLLVITLLACAAPMLLGARMWDRIPEIVESGLIGPDGQDDSIPRWMVAFGLPGLMCILNLIAHCQLLLHQKRMTLPAPHIRLMGRWGFPIISVLFCSGMIFQSIGEPPLRLTFVTPCVCGLTMMLVGAHLFDCRPGSALSLNFSFARRDDDSWKALHRYAGGCWLTAGLLAICYAMLLPSPGLPAAAVMAAGMAAPMLYGWLRRPK